MRILKTPWKDDFITLVSQSKKSIKITSPFVKENICNDMISAKLDDVRLNLITSFKMMNIYAGSLDLQGLEKIIKGKGVIQNHQSLHSKIYIFDDEKMVITSANLTNGGLINNYEYGIFTDNREIVNQAVDDFIALSNNEKTGNISLEKIQIVKEILSKIPPQEKIKLPQIGDTPEDDILYESYHSIASLLTGWKLEVFKCINKLKFPFFSLKEIEVFEKDLKKSYPENHNIMAKVRQQLQYLRDLGLIEFLGNGRYKKLWD